MYGAMERVSVYYLVIFYMWLRKTSPVKHTSNKNLFDPLSGSANIVS